MSEVSEIQPPFLQEARRGEKHPFQDLLYELRDEGLRVSTDEWLDLQKVLEKGKIENLDEMYFVSRSVLVKDIADYAKFDVVFGKLFFGIEPQTEDQEDAEDNEEPEEKPIEETDDGLSQDEKTQEEEKENAEQKEKENIKEIQESTQGESEETHGGNEATKDIENSPNAANQGMQKNLGAEEGKSPESKNQKGEGGGQKQKNAEGGGKQEKEGESGGSLKEGAGGGGNKKEAGQGGEGEKNKNTGGGFSTNKTNEKAFEHGKGGLSAKEIVIKRIHEVYDKDKILNYEQFGRVLAKLVTIIRDSTQEPTQKLDVGRTVDKIAKNAGAPELVWKEEIEEKPRILILFDVGGSTDRFRPIMEKLFAASVDILDAKVFYFHNAPYHDVWPQKDGNWGKHYIPIEDLIRKNPDAKLIIVGDAWMADYELWGNNSGDEPYDSLKKFHNAYSSAVWINPILEKYRDEMDESGTISDIASLFPMYELTLRGLEKATQELMEG